MSHKSINSLLFFCTLSSCAFVVYLCYTTVPLDRDFYFQHHLSQISYLTSLTVRLSKDQTTSQILSQLEHHLSLIYHHSPVTEKRKEKRKTVRTLLYVPQPRTNRFGKSQSLYPHQIYDFWWKKIPNETWYKWDCPDEIFQNLSCEFSITQKQYVEADGVVFFFPRTFRNSTERQEMFSRIQPRPQNQVYILVNIEPNVLGHENLHGESYKDMELDMLVYFSRDADVQVNYLGAYSNDSFEQLFSRRKKLSKIRTEWNVTSPIVFLASNCNRNRKKLVTQLQNYMSVDSYGSCLKNKEFPATLEGEKGSHGWDVKKKLLENYKFVLSIENGRLEDYVSEKFFQPLFWGTVPVYLGAPNIDEISPFPNSYIKIDDFKNISRLAEYLDMLDKNDALYEKFFSWKDYGKTARLERLFSQRIESIPCRLCSKLAQRTELKID